MKQNISKNCIYASFLLVLCLLFTGCTDTDYRKACEEHDFIKAYKIVQELDKFSGQEEAKRYVVLQKAMYVLEQQGEGGMMRISAITKENEAYWLPAELLDLAKTTGNSSLIESLELLEENSGNHIRPECTTIIGVLNDYFEVVDQKYQVGDDIFRYNYKLVFKIKYTKQIPQRLLNQWKKESTVGNPNVRIDVDLLDKNGNVLNYGDWDHIEIKEIESLKINDIYSVSIEFAKDLLGKAKTFRLRSIND